ncbi:MAG: cell division/cell wall cluster transcriptional repressor MraZ, partial [Treponema sp.]|nr:cell division/cell wall cluster transcriptional repressor MraZ [Treponema sp.]
QSLREYANLSKECTILGIAKYMELWDFNTYKEYLTSTEESFRDAAEEFNDISF